MGRHLQNTFISSAWVRVDRKVMCAIDLLASHVTNQLTHVPIAIHVILGTSVSSYDSTLGVTSLMHYHNAFLIYVYPVSCVGPCIN